MNNTLVQMIKLNLIVSSKINYFIFNKKNQVHIMHTMCNDISDMLHFTNIQSCLSTNSSILNVSLD